MNGFKIASRFVSRNILGSIVAILIGMKMDEWLHTKPLFLIGLLLYVIIGSIFLLVKEISNGK